MLLPMSPIWFGPIHLLILVEELQASLRPYVRPANTGSLSNLQELGNTEGYQSR